MKRTPKEVQEHGRKVCGVFSVEEAAAVLNKPRRTLYRWEAAGKMPPRVTIPGIGGRRKLYRRADILAMAQRVHEEGPHAI
jgi:excisionase family DNA binding protein